MNAEAKKAIGVVHKEAEMREIVERAKARGLVRGPGTMAPVTLKGSGCLEETVDGVKIEVRFEFIDVTPAMARAWLVGNNKRNRKLRETTSAAYAQDMRNGDWLLNHQGLAFNTAGELIDGQHRLSAVVESGCTVKMLVSHGWPAATTRRAKLMDTVDRGAARSIADMLGLQHGVGTPRYVVIAATALARVCANPKRSRKMTTPMVLGVIEAFSAGIKFAAERRPRMTGLRQANVLGAMALGYGVHPAETADFLSRLESGENLSKDNPILHCRNGLLESVGKPSQSKFQMARELADVAQHLWLHVFGKSMSENGAGHEGLDYFRLRQAEAVEKVRTLIEGGRKA